MRIPSTPVMFVTMMLVIRSSAEPWPYSSKKTPPALRAPFTVTLATWYLHAGTDFSTTF
jgi:hypothetical protein